jgi:hypothetical protein
MNKLKKEEDEAQNLYAQILAKQQMSKTRPKPARSRGEEHNDQSPSFTGVGAVPALFTGTDELRAALEDVAPLSLDDIDRDGSDLYSKIIAKQDAGGGGGGAPSSPSQRDVAVPTLRIPEKYSGSPVFEDEDLNGGLLPNAKPRRFTEKLGRIIRPGVGPRSDENDSHAFNCNYETVPCAADIKAGIFSQRDENAKLLSLQGKSNDSAAKNKKKSDREEDSKGSKETKKTASSSKTKTTNTVISSDDTDDVQKKKKSSSKESQADGKEKKHKDSSSDEKKKKDDGDVVKKKKDDGEKKKKSESSSDKKKKESSDDKKKKEGGEKKKEPKEKTGDEKKKKSESSSDEKKKKDDVDTKQDADGDEKAKKKKKSSTDDDTKKKKKEVKE